MKLESIHRAIVSVMSKGHIQITQLRQRVNKILGTHYTETTISARIGELPKGCYETLTEYKGKSRHVYYIYKWGAQARLNEQYGRKVA